ncbi:MULTISPECIES: YlmC/YmxH family sporulation protein [Clostridium]|uniref:YlmC/YmxH family sporulation protein n=1 Tax=Clostridium paridis TaxID=2803863 RepID=A0A937FG35_9CLOT|nr:MULTISPECIES: YlmC/YmxH family sporulation protein [Clostridium]MBL4930786.1 YlmC/YmxH family sporulation protein [Clostridium paridis]MDD7793640.1 YlmC/YmxH family sporulation protein [Clostridium sp. 'White wine YQ']
MEEILHSLNAIRTMEVIDIERGIKIGFARDFKINCDNNSIESILIPIQKGNWFGKMEYIEIAWGDIIKIGEDVILVNLKEIAQEIL